jgi:hypothetical protein
LSKKVLLLHDNTRPHTAKFAVETISCLGFEVLERPAYSPDLAPSDCSFGPPKDAIRVRRFPTDEEVQGLVHKWLRDQPETFFMGGITQGCGLLDQVH